MVLLFGSGGLADIVDTLSLNEEVYSAVLDSDGNVIASAGNWKEEYRDLIDGEQENSKYLVYGAKLEKSGWRRDNPELCSECYLFENHICRKIQGKIWYFSRIQYENGLRGMKQGFN